MSEKYKYPLPLSDGALANKVVACENLLKDHTTPDQMTIIFNMAARCLRFFMVCGSKKACTKLVNDFHGELLKQIEEHYE